MGLNPMSCGRRRSTFEVLANLPKKELRRNMFKALFLRPLRGIHAVAALAYVNDECEF